MFLLRQAPSRSFASKEMSVVRHALIHFLTTVVSILKYFLR